MAPTTTPVRRTHRDDDGSRRNDALRGFVHLRVGQLLRVVTWLVFTATVAYGLYPLFK
ncbi:hypothetical protein ABZ319_37625 [Nocardia sp. NPDC005978]|uniref:hypothetical protein n=1 Tax=Nocardia sp. NPDC005978 TaxID=3156725 RepID=UPI0033AE7074